MAQDGVLFSQEFPTERGVLRVVIDAQRIQQDIENYWTKLMQARGIPIDMDNLSPSDTLVALVTQKMPWIAPDQVFRTASQRYHQLADQARSHAALIATTLTSDKSIFVKEPEEWPAVAQNEYAIEGDVDFPEPVFNLLHPVERRLKQVIEVMTLVPDVMNAIERAANTALIVAQRGSPEVDEDGFQPQLVSKPLRRKAVTADVEPGP